MCLLRPLLVFISLPRAPFARHCAQISKECVDVLLEQVPDDDRTEYIAAFGVRGRDTTPATRAALRQACAKLCRQIAETVTAQIADAPASQ